MVGGAIGSRMGQGLGYGSRKASPGFTVVVAGLVVFDLLQELVALVVFVGLAAEVFEEQLADGLVLDDVAITEMDSV